MPLNYILCERKEEFLPKESLEIFQASYVSARAETKSICLPN